MRKLISTDLDGTIILNAAIGEADLAAMARWRAAGNLLVLNTGRSLGALRHALEGVDLAFDRAILYTGAVLIDGSYEILEAADLPLGVADDVLELVRDRGQMAVFATTLDGDLLLHDAIGSSSQLLSLFERGSRADLDGRRLVGVPVRGLEPTVLDEVHREVERRWEGVVVGFRNQDFLDIVPAGSSKGGGLVGLVHELTAPGGACAGERIETWSLGDSWNDITMHQAADHAAALPWSPPEVVAAAGRTVGSLAELVEELLGR